MALKSSFSKYLKSVIFSALGNLCISDTLASEKINLEEKPPQIKKEYDASNIFDDYLKHRDQYIQTFSLEEKSEKRKRIPILIAQGGGGRGLMPTIILEALEKEVGPISKIFDVTWAVSTGSIYTSALNIYGDVIDNPLCTASDMVKLYTDKTKEIFGKSYFPYTSSLGGLRGPRYDNKPLKDILKSNMGDRKMGDMISDVTIVSYDCNAEKPIMYNSRKAKSGKQENVLIADTVVSSCSAPTFFEPVKSGEQNLVDGGIYSNNPVGLAVANTCLTYDVQWKDCFTVSLGTGISKGGLSWDESYNMGTLGWAPNIIETLLKNQALDDMTNFMMQLSGSKIGEDYFPIQFELPKELHKLDDGSPEFMSGISKIAKQWLGDNKVGFGKLCSSMKEIQDEKTEREKIEKEIQDVKK